jgi:hypothetical protein
VGNQDESLIYGGGGADGADNWLCDKCIWKATTGQVRGSGQASEPTCSLCVLNGGALKLADDKNKWAHVSCALCVDGVTFKSPETRGGLSMHGLNGMLKKERSLNRECVFCHSFVHHQTLVPTGVTVKCKVSSCKTRFHVTCAEMQGKCMFFSTDSAAECTSFLCHEHAEKMTDSFLNRKVFILFLLGVRRKSKQNAETKNPGELN